MIKNKVSQSVIRSRYRAQWLMHVCVVRDHTSERKKASQISALTTIVGEFGLRAFLTISCPENFAFYALQISTFNVIPFLTLHDPPRLARRSFVKSIIYFHSAYQVRHFSHQSHSNFELQSTSSWHLSRKLSRNPKRIRMKVVGISGL